MNTGSVRQRHTRTCPRLPNGEWAPHRCRGAWEYVIEVGRNRSGRRRQLTKGGYPTRKEARAAMDNCLENLRGGVDVETRMTLDQYLEEWLASKRSLRPSTLNSYGQHVEMYLRPLLGHIALRELRSRQIDLFIEEISKARGVHTLSPATVRRIFGTLRVALNDAARRRLIPFSPAQHIELPSEHREGARIWTPQQVSAFLSHVKDDRLYAAYHLVIMTGLRRGELCGLRWRDVDLDRGLIRVSQSAVQVGGKLHIGPPKTRAGARTVALDAISVDVLRLHREQQDLERRAWGPSYRDSDLVFAREDGYYFSPEKLSRRFRSASAAAALPVIRFHDLRHTSASLALAAGVAMKVVSERLGHSTTAITADLYSHVIPAVAQDAADAIARAVQAHVADAARERIVSAQADRAARSARAENGE